MTTFLPRARWLVSAWTATALFLLLTIWFTWPQIRSLDSVYPHQDPMFSTWRVAWIAHQLPRDPLHLLDANILHPAPGSAVFSDAAPLLGLFAAPLLWLGASAVFAYNVMLLAAFVTAALGAFLLVRELTGSAVAGLFAGIVFAFSPFRFEHYMHLEIVWSCWVPLSLWTLHRTIATGRWLFGILTGLFLAAQVFSCVYLAVFLATWLVVIGVLMLAFRMLDLRSHAFRALVAGAIIGGVIVAPYGRAYMSSSRVVGTRSAEETQMYSAKMVNYLASPPVNRLYGFTSAAWGQNEKALFPGVTAIVLALIGLWPPLCRRRLLYALALLFAFDLSRGLYGFTYGALRDAIPFFQGLRVPARAATMVQLALAVLGGYGITRLLGARRAKDGSARDRSAGDGGATEEGATDGSVLADSRGATAATIGAAVTALAVLLTIVEYTNRPIPLMPLRTRPAVLHSWLAEQRDIVIAELPIPWVDRLPGEDPRYQFLSTFHWRKMVNGYSAFVPPRYVGLMERMLTFPDRASLGSLRVRGVTHIVIHPELYQSGDPHELVRGMAGSPDFSFVGWFPDGIGTAAVFRLLPEP
jgi:hypothetical protein